MVARTNFEEGFGPMTMRKTWIAAVPTLALAIGLGTLMSVVIGDRGANATDASHACAGVTWPDIPALCIHGYSPTVDRVVTVNRTTDPYLTGAQRLNGE